MKDIELLKLLLFIVLLGCIVYYIRNLEIPTDNYKIYVKEVLNNNYLINSDSILNATPKIIKDSITNKLVESSGKTLCEKQKPQFINPNVDYNNLPSDKQCDVTDIFFDKKNVQTESESRVFLY